MGYSWIRAGGWGWGLAGFLCTRPTFCHLCGLSLLLRAVLYEEADFPFSHPEVSFPSSGDWRLLGSPGVCSGTPGEDHIVLREEETSLLRGSYLAPALFRENNPICPVSCISAFSDQASGMGETDQLQPPGREKVGRGLLTGPCAPGTQL